MDIRELREKRGKLIADARGIIEKAEKENRNMNDDETRQYDAMIAEQSKIKDTIAREERQAELEREAADNAIQTRSAKVEHGANPQADEYRAAFRKFIMGGKESMSFDEVRALSVGTDASGGYLVPPEQFVSQLIKGIDDAVFMRAKATKLTLANAQSLGIPTLAADPADADWTTEILTGNEDGTMAFGKRSFTPNPLAKRIKISNMLLRNSAMNSEELVISRLAFKFSVAQEKGFLTGNGSGQPLGIVTASIDGVPTTRDFGASSNTSTAITVDGLMDAKFGVKSQYWKGCEWVFHQDAMRQLSKLKDGEGQYIYRPNLTAGEPDTLLGHAINVSQFAPNTFTANQYVGMFADLSYYMIADSLTLQFQRLVELYAEANMVGFIGRLETDGAPVLAEAFGRVKLGA